MKRRSQHQKQTHQQRFSAPRTADGARRKDKIEAEKHGMPQWLRRYRDRYAAVTA
jgi:hypothetical protein